MSRPDPSDLLTPAEVAAMFGVSPKTVFNWARAGVLPAAVVTLGGNRRFRRRDVDHLLAAGSDALTADAVRLYEQGWSVHQVARAFGVAEPAMRRLLRLRTTLRERGD